MYHTNARFNRYGGFNRREHIVKFKIRDKTSSPSIIGITKAQPVTSCSSSSSSNSSLDLNTKSPPITSPKSPEHDTIFDFPDTEETLEVKLMVAAGRAIPEHHKKPTSNKKSTKKKISPVNTPSKSLSLNTTTTTTTNTNTKKSFTLKKKNQQQMNKQQSFTRSHNESTFLNRSQPTHKLVPPPPAPRKQDFLLQQQQQQQQFLQQRLVQQQFMQQQQQQQQQLFQEQQLLQVQQHQQLLLFQAQQQQQQQFLQAQQQQQLLQEQQESVFDIFDFDYNPTITTKHTSTINDSYGIGPSMSTTTPSQQQQQQQQQQQTYTFTSNLPFAPAPLPAPVPTTSFTYHNNTTNHHTSLVSVSSLLNQPQPKLPEKKRKRNLVSHLKTARGETAYKSTNTVNKFDFLSDDEDEDEEDEGKELIPIRSISILKERSPSPPELTYSERMELELESMTSTQPPIINESKTKRVPYQPQNKLNVKFTFEKKKS